MALHVPNLLAGGRQALLTLKSKWYTMMKQSRQSDIYLHNDWGVG